MEEEKQPENESKVKGYVRVVWVLNLETGGDLGYRGKNKKKKKKKQVYENQLRNKNEEDTNKTEITENDADGEQDDEKEEGKEEEKDEQQPVEKKKRRRRAKKGMITKTHHPVAVFDILLFPKDIYVFFYFSWLKLSNNFIENF